MSGAQKTVYRSEHKYLLDASRAAALTSLLARTLYSDPHNKSTGYRVRSLYFDTPNLDDLRDKTAGVAHRQKLRLRIYDARTEVVLLEQKEKYGDKQIKRSRPITRSEARKLMQGAPSALSWPVGQSAAGFDGLLAVRRPTLLIDYRRLAFVWPLRNTRITLDSDIRYSAHPHSFFSEMPPWLPLRTDGSVVLEVKYDGVLEPFIAEQLAPFCGPRLSFGKYEQCLFAALGAF